jgi:hypothetical protein
MLVKKKTWGRVFLMKFKIAQMAKEFMDFPEARRLTNILRRMPHWTVS